VTMKNQPTWKEKTSLTDLRAFAKGSPTCTIARKSNGVAPVPVTGVLQVENHVRSEIPRYGWQRFTHPAFEGGELIVNYEGYFESHGYLLKKDTIPESA
jgi:hypothetical protein